MATITRSDWGVRAGFRRALKPVALVAAIGATALPVHAEAWRINTGVSTQAVLSSNPSLAASGSEEPDLRLRFTPYADLDAQGGRYRLRGRLAGDGYLYLAGTGENQFFPNSSLDLNVEAVDQWVYLDANFAAETSSANLSEATFQDGPANRRRTYRQRISPYLDHQLTPDTSIFARSDLAWVQAQDSADTSVYDRFRVESDTVRFDTKPKPFGLRLEGSHAKSSGDGFGSENTTFDLARASLLWAPTSSLFVGVTGGRDQGAYAGVNVKNTLRGGLLHWAPTERTMLDVLGERRFFGNGWSARFTHRSPYLVVSASTSRQATTYAMQLAGLSGGAASLESLLNAAYMTRYSDASQRLTRVQNELASWGLPSTLAQPSVVDAAGSAQILQNAELSALFLGVRHRVLARIYRQTTTNALGQVSLPVGQLPQDTKQIGWSAELTRTLSPQTNGNLEVSWSRTSSVESGLAGERTNAGIRLGLSHRLSPKTTGTIGVRQQFSSSTIENSSDVHESAIYAGANHRF